MVILSCKTLIWLRHSFRWNNAARVSTCLAGTGLLVVPLSFIWEHSGKKKKKSYLTPASVSPLSNKAGSLCCMYRFNEFCLAAIFILYTVLNMRWFLKYILLNYHSLNETSSLLLCEELRQSADEIEFFYADRDAISSNQSDGFN